MLALVTPFWNAAATEDTVQPLAASVPSAPPKSEPAPSAISLQAKAAGVPKRADFAREQASRDARQLADWIVDSGDNLNLTFVIVDKTNAKVFVFDAAGRIRGAAPALLGSARGDETVPDIGKRELSAMGPEVRVTPAGRFVASLGRNFRGEDVVWVDYDAGLSLHRVLTIHPEERRLQRLATRTPLDNRISYGCINVPTKFYEKVVAPAFAGTEGIVYILPETRPAREVFGSYDIQDRARMHHAAHAAQDRVRESP